MPGTIVDVFQESRRLAFGVPGAPQRGQAWHRSVCDAVEKGDSWTARDAMQNHMQQVAENAASGQQTAAGQPAPQ